MTDVFISYKAEDRVRVQRLVRALEADGLSVWWDAQIGGGERWREAIQTELEGSRCVIVAWSRRSIGPEGHFVRDEASWAQRRGVYLPVQLDRVDLPLGFGETQALSLVGWTGQADDPRFRDVLMAARAMVSGESEKGSRRTTLGPVGRSRRAMLIGGGSLAAVGVLAGGGWYAWRGLSATGGQSIAVLPFANLSGDLGQAYFADGMAEELRTALAQIDGLKVIARISSEAVRALDAVSAARKLGVTTILTGSVRRSNNLVRIATQLVDGTTGGERWSDSFDRPNGDVLLIQGDIAKTVAEKLRVTFGDRQQAKINNKRGTNNAAAYDLYLKAQALRRKQDTPESANLAISLLQSAVTLDPNFAPAYAVLSGGLSHKALYTTSSLHEEVARLMQDSETAARRAIKLGPMLPDGYLQLAYLVKDRLDFRQALALYRRASFLGSDEAAIGNAFFFAEMGYVGESLSSAARAVSSDPLNPNSFSAQGDALYFARRYGDAIASFRKMLVLAPDRFYARYFIGLSLMWLGRFSEALREFGEMPTGDVFRCVGETITTARMGDRAASDRALAKVKVSNAGFDLVAFVRAQRREPDLAFAALDDAWRAKDGGLAALRCDPLLDPLRPDPRFAALMRKLDFP